MSGDETAGWEHLDFDGVEAAAPDEFDLVGVDDPGGADYWCRLQDRVTEMNIRRSAELTVEASVRHRG